MVTANEVVSNILSKDVETYSLGITQLKTVATEDLLSLIDNPNSRIRYWVIVGLAEKSNQLIVPQLIEKLNDKDIGVCGTIAYALGKSGDARAKEPLIKFLKNINIRRWWWPGLLRNCVKIRIAHALVDLEAVEALDFLEKAVRKEKGKIRGGLKVATVYKLAIENLRKLQKHKV
jgi:HEAT repeats